MRFAWILFVLCAAAAWADEGDPAPPTYIVGGLTFGEAQSPVADQYVLTYDLATGYYKWQQGLHAGTVDGSDDYGTSITGGGSSGAIRGAGAAYYGNEFSLFSLYGDMFILAGDGDGGANKGDIFFITDSTANQTQMKFSATEKLEFAGDAPTVSTCGTTPSIVGNSISGAVTTGTGTPTACTLTFGEAWVNAPHCTVMPRSATPLNTYLSAVSTTAITFSWTTIATSTVFDYICLGHY